MGGKAEVIHLILPVQFVIVVAVKGSPLGL